MDGRPARMGRATSASRSRAITAPVTTIDGRLGDGRVRWRGGGRLAMAAGAAPTVPGRITAVCGQIAGSASTSAPGGRDPEQREPRAETALTTRVDGLCVTVHGGIVPDPRARCLPVVSAAPRPTSGRSTGLERRPEASRAASRSRRMIRPDSATMSFPAKEVGRTVTTKLARVPPGTAASRATSSIAYPDPTMATRILRALQLDDLPRRAHGQAAAAVGE